MAYERTWQPMVMQGPRVAVSSADATARHLWELAQMLLGRHGATLGLYTVYYSSDGTAPGTGTPGDGVDRWTNIYDATKIPNSPVGSGAHGWMVLTRQWTIGITVFNVYLLLSNRGWGAACTGRVLVTAGLGTPTGGSATTDPTMSIIAFVNSLQTNVAADNSTDFINPRRYYGNLSTSGDFWFGETILGEFCLGQMMFQPVGVKSNDQCPFYGHSMSSYTAGGQFPFAGAWLYLRAALTASCGGSTTAYNGVAAQFPALDAPPVFSLLDSSDASIFDKPAFVTVGNAASATAIHSRGRLPDTGLSSGAITNGVPSSFRPVNTGTTIRDPATLNIVYVTANAMILPYNASIT